MMEKQYPLLHRLGIGYIELRGVNGKNISELSHTEAEKLKRELDREGIRVSAIGSPLGKITLSEDFAPHLALAEKLMDFAKILDTPNVRVFSFYAEGDPAAQTDAVMARMEQLVAIAAKRDIVLLHENEKGIYGDTAPRCLELMRRFYGAHFRCTFDFANFVQCGEDTLEAYELLRPYIAYVHIKDARGQRIVPAGQGDGNLREILRRLFDSGYRGFLSLEPHLTHFQGLDALEQAPVTQTDSVPGDVAFQTAFDALMQLL